MTDAALIERNTNAFVWFRVLFNSRFYYPIFTVLFLDLGLSLEQFAMLNVVWGASIVLFEVPSGALADRLGRRKLVIFSAWLMILEMAIFCLVPAHGGQVTFWLLMVNRVISGLAEACCSGADEALIYDVLPADNRAEAWTRVLARLMKYQSLGFMLVALTGAALYDADFLNRVLAWLGTGTTLSPGFCHRLPLILNLGMAIATLLISLRFIDTHPVAGRGESMSHLIRGSFAQMAGAARWILRTPAAVALILTGLFYDAFMRLFYSVASNYYRLLGIPESMNGAILAGSSLLGIGTAFMVERLVGTLPPSRNMGMVAGLILCGLCGVAAQFMGWTGVLFVVPFWLGMRSLHYFLSQYLNRVSDSAHRATVLSFKGLSMNLAYCVIMQCYVIQTAWLRQKHEAALAPLPKEEQDMRLLSLAMPLWPWIFGALALLLVLWIRLRYRRGLTGLMQLENGKMENEK